MTIKNDDGVSVSIEEGKKKRYCHIPYECKTKEYQKQSSTTEIEGLWTEEGKNTVPMQTFEFRIISGIDV